MANSDNQELERTWDNLPQDLFPVLQHLAEQGYVNRAQTDTMYYFCTDNSMARVRRKVDSSGGETYLYTWKSGFANNSLVDGEDLFEAEFPSSPEVFHHNLTLDNSVSFLRYSIPNTTISIDVYPDVYLDEFGNPTREKSDKIFMKLEMEVNTREQLRDLDFFSDVLPALPLQLRELNWNPRLCSDRSIRTFIDELDLQIPRKLGGPETGL